MTIDLSNIADLIENLRVAREASARADRELEAATARARERADTLHAAEKAVRRWVHEQTEAESMLAAYPEPDPLTPTMDLSR